MSEPGSFKSLHRQKVEAQAKAHGGRAHSRIGPSAAHRWMECPGSVRRSAHMPNRSTVFTLEGTAAHEFNEHILTVRHDPRDYLGGIVNLKGEWARDRFVAPSIVRGRDMKPDRWDTFLIDEEMVDGCEQYRDYIDSVKEPDSILAMEMRLDMTHIHPDLYGTGDFFVLSPSRRHLHVIDYKYGSGVAVDAELNEQLMTYGCGGLWAFREHRIDTVTLAIIQPRAFHRLGPVRTWDTDVIELAEFERVIGEKARETDQENARVAVGDHCKFCPVAHACKELRDHVFALVGAEPDIIGRLTVESVPHPMSMTSDQLGIAYQNAQLIESWARAVMRFGHSEATEGRVPTGMKMVEKRAYRRWAKDPDSVIAELDLLGVPAEQYMTTPEPELKSVANVENAIGKKKAKGLLAGLFSKRSSGFVLARLDDARSDVLADHTEGFGEADEGATASDPFADVAPRRSGPKRKWRPASAGTDGEAFGAVED